jgi:hypothetical protein
VERPVFLGGEDIVEEVAVAPFGEQEEEALELVEQEEVMELQGIAEILELMERRDNLEK